MDKDRFADACEAARNRERAGIGTMGEKGIHNALKHYYEPDESCHEVPVGGFVADIVGEDGIIEIQSATFYKLREKLARFLEAARVTVVWPCVEKKRIITMDRATGEMASIRRSPKHVVEHKLLCELWWIKDCLLNPRLSFIIARLEADEIRPAGEKRRRGRGGAIRTEKMPTALLGEIRLSCAEDYLRFLPDGMPEEFTTRDYSAATGLRVDEARNALSVLALVGTVKRTGKSGASVLYSRNDAGIFL